MQEISNAFPTCAVSLSVMTLSGSWGGAHQWLFNNFKTYLVIRFSTIKQVRFNALVPEDYFLSFTVPAPGLWRDANQKPLNYGQKPQEALSRFIRLFTQPGEYILDAFAGTHSASLAAVLAGRNAIAVEKDAQQWRYALTNLPQQYSVATLSQTTTTASVSASSSSAPTSQTPDEATSNSHPPSPDLLANTQPALDFDLPNISQCPGCYQSVIDTIDEVLQCSAPTCERTFHPACGLPLSSGELVCTQQCYDNVTSTSSTTIPSAD
jgi:hypothetical protein